MSPYNRTLQRSRSSRDGRADGESGESAWRARREGMIVARRQASAKLGGTMPAETAGQISLAAAESRDNGSRHR